MATPREVKIGAFVLAGMITIGIVVFLIGDERQLFTPKVDFKMTFQDVQGLKRGSPVHMGGITVGTVSSVGYAEDPSDSRLHVVVSMSEDEAVRVRKDSKAKIENKGMLGDKMIIITVGSMDEPRIPPGEQIPTEESKDLAELMSKIGSIGTKADSVMTNLEKTTGSFAEEKFQKDVRQTASSLANILKAVDEGDGYASKLLHDPEEAAKLSRTLSNLERTSRELNRTMRGLNAAISRVNRGPGFAHELIYGDAPTTALTQFGAAAGEVALTLRGVREGDGMARSMLYGGDENSRSMMSDAAAISRDLRAIVAGVRAGKGTIGALLVDPSVYEDLKMVLGNVERNKVLRALVRYSIRRDERAPSVEVTDPAPKSPSASGGDSGEGAAVKVGSGAAPE